MTVLSIPAPWMVMAFILAPWPVFHPFVHTAVPAGSCTVSPSLAASIASQTASGVKLAAVRVSARTALGSKPFALTSRQHTNNHRNRGVLILIASPALYFWKLQSNRSTPNATVHGAAGDWSIFRPISLIRTNDLCPKTWTCPLSPARKLERLPLSLSRSPTLPIVSNAFGPYYNSSASFGLPAQACQITRRSRSCPAKVFQRMPCNNQTALAGIFSAAHWPQRPREHCWANSASLAADQTGRRGQAGLVRSQDQAGTGRMRRARKLDRKTLPGARRL